MSKVMKQLSFGRIMDWALGEYEREGSVFGVSKLYRATPGGCLEIFGEKLELPFGPAAGPHTQLAQNLVAGYAAGARFFELKTVQFLDGEDLDVSKPCITAADEAYNVEWSTELRVPEAMDEYIKGWFAIKLLSKELGLQGPESGAMSGTKPGAMSGAMSGIKDGEGFVFNMSVGYDLAGIQTKKIDSFIEGLKDAGGTDSWKRCKQWALENLRRFRHIDEAYVEGISPRICNSITLSTLHGCPPDEIERIAAYLLTEKKLHTYVKCNPTLLGYEYARETLYCQGFDYLSFDDHHFRADLQFGEAVPMLGRLMALADGLSLGFGVKLTNTFPVRVTAGELPGEEMYMSGRALFPLSIEVANRLSKAFGGKLRISFSGGADIHNIGEIYDTGIWPITLATTLLKPGGYRRLGQLAGELAGRSHRPLGDIDLEKLDALAYSAKSDLRYRKLDWRQLRRKSKEHVPLLGCFSAPCRNGCPFGQDIPAYLRLAGEGKYLEALKVITERNPLPFITGTICSHRCMDKCSRGFYERSVDIRAVKLEAAEKAHGELLGTIASEPFEPKSGEKIAVIGGGPAGLSAAYFLARAGCRVTIFEKRDALGGVVRHVIPEFRIDYGAIENDVAMLAALGVEVRLNCELAGSAGQTPPTGQTATGQIPTCQTPSVQTPSVVFNYESLYSEADSEKSADCGDAVSGSRGVTVVSIDELRAEGYTKFIVAVGAWEPEKLDLEEGRAMDALEFLEQAKKSPDTIFLGDKVAVIGGGNTAMDTARAAKRIVGVKRVYLIYRRTARYMPADPEELALAQGDAEFFELLSPVSHNGCELTCAKMELGAPDASGRRSPSPTGETVEIPAMTVISAVGNHVDTQLYERLGIAVDGRGRAVVNGDTLETNLPGVYVAGDAARGPATVAEAIADAIKCARAITGAGTERYAEKNINPDPRAAECKKGILYKDCSTVHESERCLECPTLCGFCVDVCPNRANVSVSAGGRPEIVHIDSLCNECGNCEVFCPYSSAPYLDKFTLFDCEEDFEGSKNAGFLPRPDMSARVRLDGEASISRDGEGLPDGIWALIQAVRERKWLAGEAASQPN